MEGREEHAPRARTGASPTREGGDLHRLRAAARTRPRPLAARPIPQCTPPTSRRRRSAVQCTPPLCAVCSGSTAHARARVHAPTSRARVCVLAHAHARAHTPSQTHAHLRACVGNRTRTQIHTHAIGSDGVRCVRGGPATGRGRCYKSGIIIGAQQVCAYALELIPRIRWISIKVRSSDNGASCLPSYTHALARTHSNRHAQTRIGTHAQRRVSQ
jgi:hypothetical protein